MFQSFNGINIVLKNWQPELQPFCWVHQIGLEKKEMKRNDLTIMCPQAQGKKLATKYSYLPKHKRIHTKITTIIIIKGVCAEEITCTTCQSP